MLRLLQENQYSLITLKLNSKTVTCTLLSHLRCEMPAVLNRRESVLSDQAEHPNTTLMVFAGWPCQDLSLAVRCWNLARTRRREQRHAISHNELVVVLEGGTSAALLRYAVTLVTICKFTQIISVTFSLGRRRDLTR